MSSYEQRSSQPQPEKSLSVQMNDIGFDRKVDLARRHVRNPARARDALISLVALDEECAVRMMYSLPKKSEDGSRVEGPSIRFAESLAATWGNNETGSRIVSINRAEKYVEAEGLIVDLETNATTSRRVTRRISTKDGRLYGDDMIMQTANAACSLALRNAILGGIPRPVWNKAYTEAREIVGGSEKQLPKKRLEAIAAFSRLGVPADQVLLAIGVQSEKEIGVDELVTLRGMHSAIVNGEATKEEIFQAASRPALPPAEKQKARTLDDAAKVKVAKTQLSEAIDATPAEVSDEAEETPEAIAYNRGYEDFGSGVATSSKYLPKEYAEDIKLADAYRSGVKNARAAEGMSR